MAGNGGKDKLEINETKVDLCYNCNDAQKLAN